MDLDRQTLEPPEIDPEPQGLPRVHPAVGPPQSKPGRVPHPIEAARRGAINTPPGLAEQGDRFHARRTEV
jgi:hypothetical protein